MGLLKIKRKGERNDVDDVSMPHIDSDQLGISEVARDHLTLLVKEKSKQYLRVAIRGGGCSGLSIHYELCDNTRDNDQLFSNGDAVVVIDKKSLSILGGATLHCRDYLGSKEFYLVNNPAAKQCSCGQSFSL